MRGMSRLRPATLTVGMSRNSDSSGRAADSGCRDAHCVHLAPACRKRGRAQPAGNFSPAIERIEQKGIPVRRSPRPADSGGAAAPSATADPRRRSGSRNGNPARLPPRGRDQHEKCARFDLGAKQPHQPVGRIVGRRVSAPALSTVVRGILIVIALRSRSLDDLARAALASARERARDHPTARQDSPIGVKGARRRLQIRREFARRVRRGPSHRRRSAPRPGRRRRGHWPTTAVPPAGR